MFLSKFWSQVCGGQSQARPSGDNHLPQLDQVSLILHTHAHTHSLIWVMDCVGYKDVRRMKSAGDHWKSDPRIHGCKIL